MSEKLDIQEELFNNFGKVAVEFGIFEKFCKDNDYKVDTSIFNIDPRTATADQCKIIRDFFTFASDLFFDRILKLKEPNDPVVEVAPFEAARNVFS